MPAQMRQKSWGLFGGKWEAKTGFRGLGGQINYLDLSQYPCWFPRNYWFLWICEKRTKRDFESAGRAFESPRVRHL